MPFFSSIALLADARDRVASCDISIVTLFYVVSRKPQISSFKKCFKVNFLETCCMRAHMASHDDTALLDKMAGSF